MFQVDAQVVGGHISLQDGVLLKHFGPDVPRVVIELFGLIKSRFVHGLLSFVDEFSSLRHVLRLFNLGPPQPIAVSDGVL